MRFIFTNLFFNQFPLLFFSVENNREVIRFFSLHADKISEKRMTDACECLLAMLDVNFASLTPGLVTSTFIQRVLEGLHDANTTNDLRKRLQLCHALYVYGGSAFPCNEFYQITYNLWEAQMIHVLCSRYAFFCVQYIWLK